MSKGGGTGGRSGRTNRGFYVKEIAAARAKYPEPTDRTLRQQRIEAGNYKLVASNGHIVANVSTNAEGEWTVSGDGTTPDTYFEPSFRAAIAGVRAQHKTRSAAEHKEWWDTYRYGFTGHI